MQEWVKLAQHRRQSLNQVLSETSYKEFLLIKKQEEIEFLEYDKKEYYLAQIALVLASAFSNKGADFKLKDFLFDFSAKEPLCEIDGINNSIAAWEAVTGKKAEFKDDN